MTKITDTVFLRGEHVCPWWICFTFDNPLRGLVHDPYKILGTHVKEGDAVLDIGPGMGYFTFPLSRLVGAKGKVVALDIQEEMSKRLAGKAAERKAVNINAKIYDGSRFALEEKFDFILLFWMCHEVRNKPEFIAEIGAVMKSGARVLVVEPKIHVTQKQFDASVQLFSDGGFIIAGEPGIALSRSVLLEKAG